MLSDLGVILLIILDECVEGGSWLSFNLIGVAILFWDMDAFNDTGDWSIDEAAVVMDGFDIWGESGCCSCWIGANGDLGVGGWATFISIKNDLSIPANFSSFSARALAFKSSKVNYFLKEISIQFEAYF